MHKQQRLRIICGLLCITSCALGALVLWAQTPPPAHGPGHEAKKPIRISMDELHRHGGVPPGWQFTLPEGDPQAGREAFVTLQCYTCHTIAGEQFPPVQPSERAPAPDLTGVGASHPAAYIAESILNPNAVVTNEPGYADANGYSNMPSYLEALSVRQLVDLVAYLHSLQGTAPQHHHTAPGTSTHQHHAPVHQHHPGGVHTTPPAAR